MIGFFTLVLKQKVQPPERQHDQTTSSQHAARGKTPASGRGKHTTNGTAKHARRPPNTPPPSPRPGCELTHAIDTFSPPPSVELKGKNQKEAS